MSITMETKSTKHLEITTGKKVCPEKISQNLYVSQLFFAVDIIMLTIITRKADICAHQIFITEGQKEQSTHMANGK